MRLLQVDQSPSRVKKVLAYNCHTQTVTKLPFRCVRKPPRVALNFPYFCFVSNPSLITTEGLDPFMWLHCYRKPSIICSDKPKHLFPESDFMDAIHCPVSNRDKTKQDYVYFTISGPRGDMYKGLDNFMRDASTLQDLKLGGKMVFYNGIKHLEPNRLKILKQIPSLRLHKGRLTRKQVVSQMAKSRFGFFPNKLDCSPRMIPECFLQNRPAVVSDQILGGWHYFKNPGFGAMYTPGNAESLRKAIAHAVSLPHNQRDLWNAHYGFEKSAKRLAELLRQHHPCKELDGCTHAYFRDYKSVFIHAPEIFHDTK